MHNNDDIILNEKEAAKFMKIAFNTLVKMRLYKEDHPPYYKFGDKSIRYKKNDLIEWLNKHRRG